MERSELSLNDKGRNIMKNRTQTLLFDNRKLAALLIPLALDQLLNSFMGSVDTFVVSNLGSAAISAVSLVDSINMLIVQAFFALASGGTVVCSHYLGLRNREHANGAARQLVFITLFLSVVITVLCLIFNHQILRVIFGEVEPEVMEKASSISLFPQFHTRLLLCTTTEHQSSEHRKTAVSR